jgi:hypothetical protein
VREAILAEEQERSMQSPDGRNMLVELDKTPARVDRINGERTAEARRLSRLVMGISNSMDDMGMLLVQDIPQHPKSAQEVLSAVGLILEHL